LSAARDRSIASAAAGARIVEADLSSPSGSRLSAFPSRHYPGERRFASIAHGIELRPG
jgi:hypothetical protein